jgi:uncharacterized membrane protein
VSKGRLEAFSDGVIAIIITIMVLEMKAPHGTELELLRPLIPVLLSYTLSFVLLGIYWNNHHHLFQIVHVIDGRVLWANLGLLFSLSLFPFGTAWLGETGFASLPLAIYGTILLTAALAYWVLVRTLLRIQPAESRLAEAIGPATKGKISPLFYVLGIPVAFVAPWISFALYTAVALLWVVPDRRIERTLAR